MIKEVMVRLANCIAAGDRRLTAMCLPWFVHSSLTTEGLHNTYLDPYAFSATYI